MHSENIIQQFKNFFDKSLNQAQQDAVSPKDGILLVSAGAGSGKTRVITARVANLIINHEVKPNSILALTFTNKAAKEMKDRISNFLPQGYATPNVGTFHSYCLRLLKSNLDLLPNGDFSLMDDNDQTKLVRSLIDKHGLAKKVTPKTVLSFISKIKNETSNEFERDALWEYNQIYKELYLKYEKAKTVAKCLDFDDLLVQTLMLFQKYPEFKQKFQRNIKHLLVDEYQDTNKIQHVLLKSMVLDNNKSFAVDSLCVVGDEDQSIYSWRGATVTNILDFNKDFPQVSRITIEQNYRSVQPILNTANALIVNNKYRTKKNLWSNQEAKDRIRLIECSSEFQEGDAIVALIKQDAKSLNNYAVLYRSHFQSRSIEEALIRNSIPYKIIGGIQFYDRQEIKDLLSYLRLIINPFDRIALSRIINTPTRGLGEKFEELFFEYWDSQPFFDFRQIACQILEQEKLTTAKKVSLKVFIDIFEDIEKLGRASDAIDKIIIRTQYYTYLKNAFEKAEAAAKIENVKELINAIMYFEEKTNQNLDIFLQEVSLLQEMMNPADSESSYVRLMTLHAAKGLEFNTVVLPGLEDGVLPSSFAMLQSNDIEEERRLLYVGITRARERLLLIHTRYRYNYGKISEQRPSRFLDEIPDEYVRIQDCTRFKLGDFLNYFRTWLGIKNDYIY